MDFLSYLGALYNLSSLFDSERIQLCPSRQSHICGDTIATTNRSADGEMFLMSWRLSGNFPQSAEQVTHSTAASDLFSV